MEQKWQVWTRQFRVNFKILDVDAILHQLLSVEKVRNDARQLEPVQWVAFPARIVHRNEKKKSSHCEVEQTLGTRSGGGGGGVNEKVVSAGTGKSLGRLSSTIRNRETKTFNTFRCKPNKHKQHPKWEKSDYWKVEVVELVFIIKSE